MGLDRKKIFIDGSAGTTGLRIWERLAGREDLFLLSLAEAERKDPAARRACMEEADIVFLCLPDEAAKEAVTLADPETVLIDTSTAHRTAEGWIYGFPEIGDRREQIASAKRIANPGCHASGAIALLAPLMQEGLLDSNTSLSITSLTGYSGGGKTMIADYEKKVRDPLLSGPRLYGLTQTHKHLPEIESVCGLAKAPVFLPVVANFYAGMEVLIPLDADQCRADVKEIEEVYRAYYTKGMVHLSEESEEGFLSATRMAGRDDMLLGVYGNTERKVLVARFDNLGKGASGAAIQNMNLVLGLPEETGLITEFSGGKR